MVTDIPTHLVHMFTLLNNTLLQNMVAFTRYGDKSRRQRRLMNSALGASAVHTYRPLLEIESLSLLKRILQDPEQYPRYIRRSAFFHHKTISMFVYADSA